MSHALSPHGRDCLRLLFFGSLRSSLKRKIFTSWDESNGYFNNKVSRTQIAFAICRTRWGWLEMGRAIRSILFRAVDDGFFLTSFRGWKAASKKMILKWIYVISFRLLFFVFLSNIVHVYITNSLASHTDNYVYFPLLSPKRQRRERKMSVILRSRSPPHQRELCAFYSIVKNGGANERCNEKYFWINCLALLLLFAKYNNKWLIMDGIFFFDWY